MSKIEYRVEIHDLRVGSCEVRVEENNELAALLTSRGINWTSEEHLCVVEVKCE